MPLLSDIVSNGGGGAAEIAVAIAAESATSGLGTEASPYVSATDATGGIQAAVNARAADRGGKVDLGVSRFTVTAADGVRITTPSISIEGKATGFNVDPNGESEGINGAKISTTTHGIRIGTVAGRVGGVLLRNLYIFGPNKTGGSEAVTIDQGVDQPRFENVNVSNVQYGFALKSTVDAAHFHQCSALNTGYGVYSTTAWLGSYTKFQGCEFSDNDNGGIYLAANADGSNRWVRIVHCTVVRNARVLTTNGANIYVAAHETTIASTVVRDAGRTAGGSAVAADGIILASNGNIVTDCTITDNSTGAGIRIRGNNNTIMGGRFSGNATDIIVESGATDNTIIVPVGTTITDNGTGTRVLSGHSFTSNSIPMFRVASGTSSPFGAFFELDATGTTGGHRWRWGATAGAAGEGQGVFVLNDQTANTNPLLIGAGVRVGATTVFTDPGAGNLAIDGVAASSMLKTNGSKVVTAAVAGTDYPGLTSANTFSAANTFTGALNLASAEIVTANDNASAILTLDANANTEGFTIPALKSLRRNAANTTFEAFTPATVGEQTNGDTNVTWTAGATLLRQTAALTANRTGTLPAANAYAAGTVIVFQDALTAGAFGIAFSRVGTDTLNGGTGAVTFFPGKGTARLVTDGGSNWQQLDQTNVTTGSAAGITSGTLNPSAYTELFEDFITASPKFFSAGGTNPPTASAASDAGHPGAYNFSTSTTTTGSAVMNDGAQTLWLLGGGVTLFEVDLQTGSVLSDGTDTYTIRAGWNDSNTGDGADGLYFRYTNAENSGRWVLAARSNSVESVTNSSITVAATTWYKLRILVDATGSSAEGFVNGASIGTVSANIPTTSGRFTSAHVSIIKSAGTTARSMSVDYIWLRRVFSTPR